MSKKESKELQEAFDIIDRQEPMYIGLDLAKDDRVMVGYWGPDGNFYAGCAGATEDCSFVTAEELAKSINDMMERYDKFRGKVYQMQEQAIKTKQHIKSRLLEEVINALEGSDGN